MSQESQKKQQVIMRSVAVLDPKNVIQIYLDQYKSAIKKIDAAVVQQPKTDEPKK